jgi:hypothetical protein
MSAAVVAFVVARVELVVIKMMLSSAGKLVLAHAAEIFAAARYVRWHYLLIFAEKVIYSRTKVSV